MRSKLMMSAIAICMVSATPMVWAQTMPMPGDPTQPADPVPSDPMPEQPQPADPMPAQPAPEPPVETPPAPSAAPIMTPPAPPQPTVATEPYPLCTKTLQDSCRNPGEGPKVAKKKR
jgi:hypothetical protein